MPFDSDDVLLAQRLKALAHPARLTIVRALMGARRCSCGDIVRNLPLAQSTVSQHLKVLREAGLVTQGRDAQWRPVRLEPSRLQEISAWVEQYRRLWEARFNRLDEYLRDLQQEEPPG
jgi:DNA-binding transcriptional ArsR family regulator